MAFLFEQVVWSEGSRYLSFIVHVSYRGRAVLGLPWVGVLDLVLIWGYRQTVLFSWWATSKNRGSRSVDILIVDEVIVGLDVILVTFWALDDGQIVIDFAMGKLLGALAIYHIICSEGVRQPSVATALPIWPMAISRYFDCFLLSCKGRIGSVGASGGALRVIVFHHGLASTRWLSVGSIFWSLCWVCQAILARSLGLFAALFWAATNDVWILNVVQI